MQWNCINQGEKNSTAKAFKLLISKRFTSEILYVYGDGVVSDTLQKLNT